MVIFVSKMIAGSSCQHSFKIFANDSLSMHVAYTKELSGYFTLENCRKKVLLDVRRNPELEFGHLLTNDWMLSFLDLVIEEPVIVQPCQVGENRQRVNVNFVFVAFRNLKHWNEKATMEEFSPSFSWVPTWPSQMNIGIVQTALKIELKNSWILCGSQIGIRVLDYQFIFSIQAPDHEDGSIVQCCDEISVIVPEKWGPTEESRSRNPVSDSFVLKILKSLPSLSGRYDNSLLFTSCLLVGFEGAGKSHYLNSIATYLSQNKNSQLAVVHFSCKQLKTAPILLNYEVEVAEEGMEMRRRLTFVCLDRFLRCFTLSAQDVQAIRDNPAISLLIDDIDLLLPAANGLEDESGGLGVNAKIASAQLAELLQSLPSIHYSSPNRSITVLGAARRTAKDLPRAHQGYPEFDKVITVPSPNRNDRKRILAAMLSSCPFPLHYNSSDESAANTAAAVVCEEWSGRLAALTAGYLPGDLRKILDKTYSIYHGKLELAKQRRTSSHGDDTSVPMLTLQAFLDALLMTPPKQLQSLQCEIPMKFNHVTGVWEKLSWQHMAGYEEVKVKLKRILLHFTTERGEEDVLLRAWNVSPPRGILLHGASGCGKTFVAQVIASEADINFVSVKSSEMLSKYFSETESRIRDVFQRARAASPCILFFDEFDSLAYARSSEDESNGLHGRVLSTFLNEMDGISGKGGAGGGKGSSAGEDRGEDVMVIAACSSIQNVDEALLRPGRLHHHILLTPPALKDIEDLVRMQLSAVTLAADLSIQSIALMISHSKPTCAAVIAFCTRILMSAIREEVDALESGNAASDAPACITMRHVLAAL